jgi:hypothetical protein
MSRNGGMALEKGLDRVMEDDLRKVLEGELDLSRFHEIHGLRGDCLESQTRMLHILNLTFRAVQSELAVRKAMEYLGGEGGLLYVTSEDPTMPYFDAVLKKGRLLTPLEYGNMLSSFEGLKILFQNAVQCQDHVTTRMVVEKAKALIPLKAIVLARMNDYTYEKVLEEFGREAGSPELVTGNEFMDFVAARVPSLDAKDECVLGLTREPTQLDHILANNEEQRTPETREALARKIIATSPKFFFTQGNNLRSKAVWEAYPDEFNFEDMARSTIRWKCEGDCMGCPNWKRSLSKKSHSYHRM